MKKRMSFYLLPPLLIACLTGCGYKDRTGKDRTAAQEPQAAADSRSPEVHIPSGTILHVRLDQSLDTKRNRAGDPFSATLASPVTVNEHVIVPQGTRFHGRVTTCQSSGRLKGRASLAVTLDSFQLNGKTYSIDSSLRENVSTSHKKRNGALIGGGAGLGALIGGLAGGAKGLVIGAGAGAGAGLAGAVITGKKQIHISAETPMSFTLRAPVRVS